MEDGDFGRILSFLDRPNRLFCSLYLFHHNRELFPVLFTLSISSQPRAISSGVKRPKDEDGFYLAPPRVGLRTR
jgi:hypothetical protein